MELAAAPCHLTFHLSLWPPPPLELADPALAAAPWRSRPPALQQGKEEVESAGRCTGGPPAVEQTPRPPALGPRPARAALALPVPPCILNTRVHRLP